jgi:hypothetical protein
LRKKVGQPLSVYRVMEFKKCTESNGAEAADSNMVRRFLPFPKCIKILCTRFNIVCDALSVSQAGTSCTCRRDILHLRTLALNVSCICKLHVPSLRLSLDLIHLTAGETSAQLMSQCACTLVYYGKLIYFFMAELYTAR